MSDDNFMEGFFESLKKFEVPIEETYEEKVPILSKEEEDRIEELSALLMWLAVSVKGDHDTCKNLLSFYMLALKEILGGN